MLLLVAACSSESSDEPAAVGSSTTTTSTTVAGPSVDEVRAAAVGTAACPGEDCGVVEDVTVDGDVLEVATGLFPDSDAETPALALCVVATQLWDGPVVVVGSEGSELASGQAGETPVCR